MQNRAHLLGHLAGITVATIWGMTFIVSTIMLEHFTPYELMFMRTTLGMLTLYLIYPKKMAKTGRKQELLFAAAGATGITTFFAFENTAILHTSTSNVSVIVAISPLFAALLGWKIYKEKRPSLFFFLGFLFAISGIALISLSDVGLGPLGDFLAILAALSWAIYSQITRKLTSFGHHIIQVTRRVFFYGILFTIPFLFITNAQFSASAVLEFPIFLYLLFLSICASACGFLLFNFCLSKIGATKATMYVYFIPLVTLIASVILLSERIRFVQIIGIMLTLTGLVLSSLKSPDQKKQNNL